MSSAPSPAPRQTAAFRGLTKKTGKKPAEHREWHVRVQRRIRNVRRWIYGRVAHVALAVLGRMPYGVMRGFSRFVLRPILNLGMRRGAAKHLRAAFPDLSAEREREILDEAFHGTSMLVAEWSGFAKQGPAFFERYVDEAEALEHVHAFEREWSGGWIGVTGHLGNWELMAQWVKHRGLRGLGGSVAKRQPNPHLNKVIEAWRGQYGMATLYREDPPGKIIRLLRSGTPIGIVPDQDTSTASGVFLDFLGQPAYTSLGPARLALAARVPLMIGIMLREGDRFRVQFDDPIFPDLDAPKNDEVLRLTAAWSSGIERLIRNHPEQWSWLHNRWKTTPEKLAARNRAALDLT